jgi:glycosyltransferase involved in cell wall biosynthesis
MRYLHEAVESILAQTFQDWHMVIIDNASSDGSAEYAEQRAQSDSRIEVVRNGEDIGVTRSLNHGLEFCRGEFVARMDSDDRALPERLERQLAFMQANPDVLVLSCLAHYINPDGERVGRAPHDLTSREAFAAYLTSNRVIGVLHPGAFMRREIVMAAGGYRPAYEFAEDIDLWNRLSEHGLVLVLPEYLLEYRLHRASTLSMSLGLAHIRREWAEQAMLARRRGAPEPAWEEFEQAWCSAPLWTRIHRARRLLADSLVRVGREDVALGYRLPGYAKLALSATLKPAYTAPRILAHLNPRARHDTPASQAAGAI